MRSAFAMDYLCNVNLVTFLNSHSSNLVPFLLRIFVSVTYAILTRVFAPFSQSRHESLALLLETFP